MAAVPPARMPRAGYRVVVLGDRRSALGECGIGLDAHLPFGQAPPEIDTLLVPGGLHTPERLDAGVVRALPALAGAARRVMSVCTGAFYLADAGLLDGGASRRTGRRRANSRGGSHR